MANNTELLNQLLSSDSLKGIASATGVSNADVTKILASSLPSLLNGAASQSTSKDTQESFANALASHATADTSNLSSFFNNVDLKDGNKIVSHLLGSNSNTAETTAQQTGVDAKNVNAVMAAAAPLLMSLLGKQTNASASANNAAVLSSATSLLGKADLSSITSLLGKNSGIDLSDGIDAKDILGIAKKLMK